METEYSPRVRWAGLVAAAAGVFLTALDITVNVALPDIANSFGADAVTIQWIIIFYVGSSAGMQLGLGGAADAFGIKRMFMLGLAAYTLAVLAIGLSNNLALVFGLRIFQAIGNGLLIALGPAIVTSLFPARFRGRALGIMAALGALGMISGSFAGGALVDALGWRAIFLCRVPICVLALVFTAAFLKVPSRSETRSDFDLLGAVTLFVSVGSLILLLSLGGRNGWTEFYIPILALISATGFWLFVVIERRSSNPSLQLSLLKHRVLAPALGVSLLVFISTFVNWFILPFFVIESLGASASVWGVLLMLMTVANSVSAPLGGWLSDRANPAYTITASTAISTVAMLMMSRLGESSSVAAVGFGLALVGIGTGLFQASSANLIMGSVPTDRLGMGGGIMGLARGMGTVSSVAIMGAVFAARESVRAVSTTPEAAFAMAFKDTYTVAVVLAATAVLMSLTLWPQISGTRTPK